MVNFETAMFWLRYGDKITRPCWKEDSYWQLGVDEMICWADNEPARIHINQFNATDWKIYREKKSLSDKIISSFWIHTPMDTRFVRNVVLAKDVKQAVEDMKEEINKFGIHKTGVHRGFLSLKIDEIFGKELT